MHAEGLSEQDFLRVTELVRTACGLNLTDKKRTMLEARLRKRMRVLGMERFADYCAYVCSEEGRRQELGHLIDVVTTNKTEFFREPQAFHFLTEEALPRLAEQGALGRGVLHVWSAACSTGEEPYTLAMVLAEAARARPAWNLRYQILATDVSSQVLEVGRRAIYPEARVTPVPHDLREAYLLHSRDPQRRAVRVVPELRERVRFQQLNLMEPFHCPEPLPVIFCRNVIIYFDRTTQERLLQRICQVLAPGGYLFMGHSETLSGMDLPLRAVGPMIYRRTD